MARDNQSIRMNTNEILIDKMTQCVNVFYWQIFDSWRNMPDAKSKHSRDMEFILVWAPGKRVKAICLVATCLYYDLIK